VAFPYQVGKAQLIVHFEVSSRIVEGHSDQDGIQGLLLGCARHCLSTVCPRGEVVSAGYLPKVSYLPILRPQLSPSIFAGNFLWLVQPRKSWEGIIEAH
jgi:hypothetical protein